MPLSPPQRLTKAREAKGFSMARLAAILALSGIRGAQASRICLWESEGSDAEPKVGQLLALSRVLGVTTDWLSGASDKGGPKVDA